MDINEITILAQEAEAKRRQNAPRTKRQLHDAILLACALPIAALHESAIQRDLLAPRETIVNRLKFLLENDVIFRTAVHSAVSNVMQTIEDYARATGLDLR